MILPFGTVKIKRSFFMQILTAFTDLAYCTSFKAFWILIASIFGAVILVDFVPRFKPRLKVLFI
ncbi:hypothetical protein [Caudoviricetes sp.]|nr:hypothetical protein [Caudoviricetes sp.]